MVARNAESTCRAVVAIVVGILLWRALSLELWLRRCWNCLAPGVLMVTPRLRRMWRGTAAWWFGEVSLLGHLGVCQCEALLSF